MRELATVEATEDDGTVRVAVRGEVDIANVQSVGRSIEAAVPNTAPLVVLDLTATTYLDSTGIALVLRLAERLRSRRHRLRVVATPGSAVRAVLELAGVGEVVPLDSD